MGGEDENKGDKKAEKAKPAYSRPFLDLVTTFRRRSFTQGGMDIFLDLAEAQRLCRDFISQHLQSNESACMAEFAKLVSEMASIEAAEAPAAGTVGEADDDDDDASEEEARDRKWFELTEQEVK